MNTLFNVLLTCALILPFLMFVYCFKFLNLKYYGIFGAGILLLVYSALVFYALSDVKEVVVNFYLKVVNPSQLDKDAYATMIKKLDLWIYVFPVAVGAIGSNLITDFIKMEKPSNRMGSNIT